MMRLVALTFALSAASATALGAFRSNAFLSSDMRPDMVAKTLQAVEGQWMAQAHVAAECQTQGALRVCEEAPRAFHKSCGTVVRAVMMGSQGDSIKVKEYMTSVCSQKTISGWHQGVCGFLGQSMVAKMSANSADNRENHAAKADATCNGLWLRFVEEQSAKVAVEVQAKAKADEAAKAQMAEDAKLAQIKHAADMEAKAEKEAMQKEEAKAEAKAKAEADMEAKAKAKAEAEANAKTEAWDYGMAKAKDAKTASTKSVATQVVKQVDSVEASIKDAFKIAPEAKVQDAGKTADAKIAADAKSADAKIQEAEKKVGEKVKAADTVETSIQAAFKQAVALPAVVKK